MVLFYGRVVFGYIFFFLQVELVVEYMGHIEELNFGYLTTVLASVVLNRFICESPVELWPRQSMLKSPLRILPLTLVNIVQF